MRRVIPALCFAATLAGCAREAPFTAAHRAAIVDSVTDMLTAFRAAAGSLDPDSLSRFYVADSTFRWIEDGAVRYTSRDDIAAAVRGLRGSVQRSRLLYDGTVITPLAPGIASVVTGFAQQFTMADGSQGGFAGAMTAVVVHRAEGWQFLGGHTSSAAAPTRERHPATPPT